MKIYIVVGSVREGVLQLKWRIGYCRKLKVIPLALWKLKLSI